MSKRQSRIISNETLRKTPNKRTMKILAENWNKLRELTMAQKREQIPYAGYDIEDVLLETFECASRVIHDKSASETIDEFTYLYSLHRRRSILAHRGEQKIIGTWRPERNDKEENDI